MNMIKVLSIAIGMLILGVAFLATPVATSANSNDCAGQVRINNHSKYVVEMIAINDPRFHLDVPPNAPYDFLGHIDYNQPVIFTQYNAGYMEKFLGSMMVKSNCNFERDATVDVWDDKPPVITYPEGFSPYFPMPWYSGWR